jgi:hypothetical protein
VGLSNVRERLAVHFGERARVVAGFADPGHWAVEIRMPVLREVPAAMPAARPESPTT